MDCIPVEIEYHLLSFLDWDHLFKCQIVCQRWFDIVGDIISTYSFTTKDLALIMKYHPKIAKKIEKYLEPKKISKFLEFAIFFDRIEMVEYYLDGGLKLTPKMVGYAYRNGRNAVLKNEKFQIAKLKIKEFQVGYRIQTDEDDYYYYHRRFYKRLVSHWNDTHQISESYLRANRINTYSDFKYIVYRDNISIIKAVYKILSTHFPIYIICLFIISVFNLAKTDIIDLTINEEIINEISENNKMEPQGDYHFMMWLTKHQCSLVDYYLILPSLRKSSLIQYMLSKDYIDQVKTIVDFLSLDSLQEISMIFANLGKEGMMEYIWKRKPEIIKHNWCELMERAIYHDRSKMVLWLTKHYEPNMKLPDYAENQTNRKKTCYFNPNAVLFYNRDNLKSITYYLNFENQILNQFAK